MELDENNMEVEPEQYYKVEEELVSVKSKMWGLDRIRSSDGHTFKVEHDVLRSVSTSCLTRRWRSQSTMRQTGVWPKL
jgi:hypothetical protein